MKKKIIILGAAGRDFHNYNMVYRDNPDYQVVGFTATQIPKIEGRTYPASLAGKYYPNGIPIYKEQLLEQIIRDNQVDTAVMSYSDLPYQTVMRLGARVNVAGANFKMLGTTQTMAISNKPVIAVTAVRTGCGKSQISRFIAHRLRQAGKQVTSIRHPMPYGNLEAQAVQRMASIKDIDAHNCTIEEREEYEKHVEEGGIIYAGVDYEAILRQAEEESDVIIWDGGNNDIPFYKPDLWITIADPLRPGHENTYYPGEINVRGSHVLVIGKANVADPNRVESVRNTLKSLNPTAKIITGHSILHVENAQHINGKSVLAVEDGPTLTHGEMAFGAATQAAKENGATRLVDPRPYAVGGIKDTFEKYPHMEQLLPAMGYWAQQIKDLETTINAVPCDCVVIGTPFNIQRLVNIKKPTAVVTYSHQDPDESNSLANIVDEFLRTL